MSTCLAQTLFDQLARRGDLPALIVDDVHLTGHQVLAEVSARQTQLHDVKQNDRVLVTTGRGSASWIDTLALWGLGATAVLCEADMDASMASHVRHKTQPSERILDDVYELARGATRAPIVANTDANALGLILFTSGTTGLPKAVPLKRSILLSNALASATRIRLADNAHLFAPVPFRFISAVSHFLAALLSGVCYEGTEARLLQAQLLERMSASGASAFGGSPMQARWLSLLDTTDESTPINLRWLMASGDHLPAATIHTLRDRYPGVAIVTAYGLTELAGRFCVLQPRHLPNAAGSVGEPIAGLGVCILDEHGEPCATDTLGQVAVSGEHGFAGYLDEADTNHSVLRNGLFHTGDLGQIDSEGHLWLSGRTDDVFKSAGIKVSTQPIAQALMALGLFDDVAIAAHPDASLGAVPHVFYCLAEGKQFVRGDVLRQLRQTLKAGELPRYFNAVERIPRTPSGKVKRAVLRQWVQQGVNPDAG